MNLAAMRNEVLNTGFDSTVYGARITQWLNDAQGSVARQVDFYGDEATQVIPTVAGTVSYAWPADMGRVRTLFNPAVNSELRRVSLRDIDRSPVATGQPQYFAVDGATTHLYPTPDGVYSLSLRYWRLPPALVNDTDTPIFPPDYHDMLISYALWKCYERDDDAELAAYHEASFKKQLAEFSTDVKFPVSDEPHQLRGMWDAEPSLGGW